MIKKLLFLPVTYTGLIFAQYSTNNILEIPFQKNLVNDKPAEMIAADFNNDGHIDVVLDGDLPMNQSGYIEFNSQPIFFAGDGAGSLMQQQTTFAHPGNSSFICDAADYNKDGFVDILVADFWGNTMRLYNGHGNFSFTHAADLPTGTHGAKGKFKDFDMDGDLDILNVSSGSAAIVFLHVFENTANTFTKSSYQCALGNFHQLDGGFNPLFYIFDINRDGRLDVMSLSTETKLNIWLQNADKSFQAQVQGIPDDMESTIFNFSIPYKVSDLNKDGYGDLICFDRISSTLVTYSNPQPPYFGAATDLRGPSIPEFGGEWTLKIVWGDVDNDGVEDYVAHNGIYDKNSFNVVKDPFDQKGNFSLLELDMGNTMNDTNGHGLLLTDLDHDNDLELISLGKDNILRIFNNSTATPSPVETCTEEEIKIYPSPAKEYIHVNICELQSEKIKNIQVYSMTGDLIATVSQTDWDGRINISGLIPGMYVLHMEMTDGNNFNKKFLKE